MDLDFICDVHRLEYRLKKIHHVLGLKEVADVGVRHDDLRRAAYVRAEHSVTAKRLSSTLDLSHGSASLLSG